MMYELTLSKRRHIIRSIRIRGDREYLFKINIMIVKQNSKKVYEDSQV